MSDIPSAFGDPNVLYKNLSGQTTQGFLANQNQLAIQQQDISGHEIEMGARLANTILDPSLYPTPEARAAAFPSLVANARAQFPGYFKNAPSVYPGDEATRALARMGTPSQTQAEWQANLAANKAYTNATAPPATAPAAPATGGGTAATTGGVPANAGALRDQLVSTLGVSPEDAGAILSNFHAESGLNAGINEIRPVIPGSRGGYGLAQWTGPRRDALEAFAQQNKLDVSQPATQIAFMKQELQQPEYAGILKDMAAAKTPEEKATIFFHGYESGGAPSLEGQLPGHVSRARAYAGLPAAQGAPGGVAARTGGTDVAGPGAGSATSAAPSAPLPRDQAVAQAQRSGQAVPVAGVDGLWALPNGNLTSTPPAATTAAPAATPQPQAKVPQPPPNRAMPGAADGPPAATPPPPAQPAPAATAQAGAPAAQQPPAPAPGATTAQPAAQAMPAELQTDNNYLTDRDRQALRPLFDQARRGLIPLTTLQNEVQQRQTFNVARQKEFLAAQQQTFENQRQAEADRRAAEQLRLSQNADQRAADEAAQKAKEANRPVQGNDVDAQHESYLYDHANEIRDGTASEAVRRQYAGSYYALQQKGGQAVQITDPNNPGGTIAATITRRLPPSLPEPPGGALPQVFTTPGAAKAPEMTAPQSQAAGFADRMRNALPVITDTSPAAMSRWQQVLGEIPLVGNTYVSADFQRHLQSERDFINAVLRRESGAAISESEFVNARKQYIPQPGDKPPVLADKARNRETVMANLVRDAGPAYRPPTGSATQPAATPPSRVIRYDHTGQRIAE